MDRLVQSNFNFESEYSNTYFQVLSKVLENDVDLKLQSAKRKSSRVEKNHSEEKDRTSGDIKARKIAEVLGSIENGVDKKWANRTGKIFEMK